MSKIVGIVVGILVTSLYFFPFEFTFLPGVNTKMAMAAFGLLLLCINMAKSKNSSIDKNFFYLSLMALGVSLASFISVVYNNTRDYNYVSYIVSMLVWSSAAYVVVSFIRWIHGKASVFLLCNYLIAVCVMQCILAVMIDKMPAFENLVNNIISGLGFVQLDMLEQSGRLYGIGASLDVAGSRFAAIFVMIAFIITHINRTDKRKYLWLYVLAIVIIGAVGNMMSRTTTVGLILFITYIIFESKIWKFTLNPDVRRFVLWMGGGLLIILPFVIYLYNTDITVKENIRFAFEGFFSLAEEGEWNVHSNNILKNMYVFPDNYRTWIIGDGYLENPYKIDPYYVGPNWGGYYKATDVGYLRFIFYFGLIGLTIFSCFMFYAGKISANKFKTEKIMFYMLLAVHFIIWLKVATDIFLVFALFLMVGQEENDEYNKSILINNDVSE